MLDSLNIGTKFEVRKNATFEITNITLVRNFITREYGFDVEGIFQDGDKTETIQMSDKQLNDWAKTKV